MTARRKPRGYRGEGHETIGSDILAIAQVLRMPDQILGEVQAKRLELIRPDEWYPIEWLLEMMEQMDKSVGRYGLLQMGRALFDLSHRARLIEVAKTASDVVFGINAMYHHANRGRDIGGWTVTLFEAGHAVLEKNTPHHCLMEEGILAGALRAMGCPSNISQSECFREGADHCQFVIKSNIKDVRWLGAR